MKNIIFQDKVPEEMRSEFNNYNILCQFLLEELKQKFNQISPESKLRKKRGLINGLGNVVKFITGNLDNDDLEQIETRLEILEKGNKDQTQVLKSQLILAKEAITQFNNTVGNLTLNQRTLRNKILQLERAIHVERIKRYHTLHTNIVYTQITVMAQNILQILETIEESITFSKLQVMHPSIIQPEDLLRCLDKVDKTMSLPFPVQADQLINFENLIKIKAYQIRYKLTFLLEIPIVDNINYNLFHIYSCPVPKMSDTFQTIIPTNKYLALTNQYYSSLENICTLVDSIYYCNNLDLIDLNENPLCETQLLLAQKPYTKCNTHLFKLSKEKIQFIENKHILLVSPSEISVTYSCDKNSQNEILPSGTYLLNKFENCKLKINDKVIQFPEIETIKELFIPHLSYNFSIETNYSIEKIDLLPINLDNLNEIKYKLEKQENVLEYTNKIDHVYIPSLWTIILYIILICFSIYIVYKLKLRLQERTKANQLREEPAELQP